jgi:S1-C subfamily serine protease
MKRYATNLLAAIVACVITGNTWGQLPDAGSSVYEKVSKGVFLLSVEDATGEVVGLGSAFLVEGQRLVTNAHVVSSGTPVLRLGPARLTLKIERLDLVQDLALLSFDARLEAPVLLFASEEPSIGEAVFAIGNPSTRTSSSAAPCSMSCRTAS